MKAFVNVKLFRESFGLVASVAPRRSPKPILEGVLFRAEPGRSELVATDLEIGIVRPVQGVDCEVAGSVMLPRDRIAAILATCRDESLMLETSEAFGDTSPVLTVQGMQSQFRLPVDDPDLFPAVLGFDAASGFVEVDAGDLGRAIARTAFATDPESTRYALGGTLWSFRPREGLTVVGTDGRQLAQQQIGAEVTGEPTIPASPVVPARALKILAKILRDAESCTQARIGWPKNAVLAECDGTSVFARLLEGRYPRYQDVFPGLVGARVDLIAGALDQVVAQAAIVTSEESRAVDFTFRPGTLVLEGKSPDVGSSRVELAIDWAADVPALVIALDPRYLVEPLRALDPDAVLRAELKDEKSAVVLRTDDGYAFVLMPLTRER